jgi:hypothetical protein
MEQVSPVEIGWVFITVVAIQDCILILTLLVVLHVMHVKLLLFFDVPRAFFHFQFI